MVNSRQTLSVENAFRSTDAGSPGEVEWRVSDGLVDYADAHARMEARVAAIAAGEAAECVWLLEHPPLYTAGTSADAGDLLDPDRFPVFKTGRGGQYTYHGPGQRVAYVMLDLNPPWNFHIRGERREDRVGVWVSRPEKGLGREDKVAAIGIRVRKWVTFHGISLNVDPDLTHFDGIVPCGVQQHGVTSLVDLGIPISMPEVDCVLRQEFEALF